MEDRPASGEVTRDTFTSWLVNPTHWFSINLPVNQAPVSAGYSWNPIK